jgi:hypothetical protein
MLRPRMFRPHMVRPRMIWPCTVHPYFFTSHVFIPERAGVFKTPLFMIVTSLYVSSPKEKDVFSSFCTLIFWGGKDQKQLVKLKELWCFLDLHDSSNVTEHTQSKSHFSDQMYKLVDCCPDLIKPYIRSVIPNNSHNPRFSRLFALI